MRDNDYIMGCWENNGIIGYICGDFLKWGYPPIIHLTGIFHEINHPFLDLRMYGNPPYIYIYIRRLVVV